MKRAACLLASILGLAAPTRAIALSAEEIYEKVSPAVVVVHGMTGGASVVSLGSGIIVRQGEVITNCHVISPGKSIHVVASGQNLMATVLFADVERDLCLLSVPSVKGVVAEIGSIDGLKPGAHVYAIGAPRGLELTISEGLVSGLRKVGDQTVIQTSAPISPGSSGGGLFDSSGRLVGITTFTLAESQNINFALPVNWVATIWERAKQAHAKDEARAARAQADGAKPKLVFATPQDAQRWLSKMSSRLEDYISNEQTRIDFLITVQYEAARAGLDPQVVLALIETLSSFRKYAVSSSGATGYMQVMPMWVLRIGQPDHDLFKLRTNIRYGCVILRSYFDRHEGDIRKALNAYHNQALGKPEDYQITTDPFAESVIARWKTNWTSERLDLCQRACTRAA